MLMIQNTKCRFGFAVATQELEAMGWKLAGHGMGQEDYFVDLGNRAA